VKVTRTGDWTAARRILASAPKRIREAQDKAVLQEAQFFRTKIVEGLRSGAPGGQALQPLAPTTLAIRRLRGGKGTKPLIRHGDLRNSIAVVREGNGVFVGVLRSAKSSGGGSLVNIAAVHEFGSRPIVVKITPKVRRFLHAAFRKAGLDEKSGDRPSTGVAVIRIPARPFLRPVFEKYGAPEEVARRFVERVAKLLGGDFGGPGG
jgi:phage gpG-like protein